MEDLFDVIEEPTDPLRQTRLTPDQIRELSEKDPGSKVAVLPTSKEARVCDDCKVEFPRTKLYFAVTARSCARRCHECAYQAKVKAGKNPIYPAKNGVDQKEYHAQLAASAGPIPSGGSKKKQMEFGAPPPTKSPWLKLPSGGPFEAPNPAGTSGQVSPTKPASAGETQGSGKPTVTTRREFAPEPQVTKDKSGGYLLTMNDYFKLGRMKTVKVREDPVGNSGSASAPRVTGSSDEVSPDPGDEVVVDGPAPPFDPRAELMKDVVTYPHTAAKLELSLERVQRMTEEDCAYWLDTFTAVKSVYSHGQIMHYGFVTVASAVESMVKEVKVNDDFHVDLSGWSQSLATDPIVAECINEICRENEETIEEYMEPEYRLALLAIGKAHQVIVHNNKRRLAALGNSEYLRNGKYNAANAYPPGYQRAPTGASAGPQS